MSDAPDDPLRSLTAALRPRAPANPEAEARIRQRVRAVVRSNAPTPAREPEGASATPRAHSRPSPRGASVVRMTLAFALGVGVGAVAHALLTRPAVRTVDRPVEVLRFIVIHDAGATVAVRELRPEAPDAATPRPSSPLVASPTVASRGRPAQDATDAESSVRVREQLQRAEQLLDAGDVDAALVRLRAMGERPTASPALLGLREELLVRALLAARRVDEARERGQRYVHTNPAGAHARAIERMLAEPRP